MFLILFTISFLANIVIVPRQVRVLNNAGAPIPTSAAAFSALAVTGLAVLAGTALASEVGLRAPFFMALVENMPAGPILIAQLKIGIVFGAISSIGILVPYYGWVRGLFKPSDIYRMESIRLEIGILVRMLQGGIIEEIVYRWGVLAIFAWLTKFILGGAPDAAMWLAILAAGVVFGLAHLQGAQLLGLEISKVMIAAAVVLNLILGLVCGWLVWEHGLLAAMVTHATVHLLWLPFDHFFHNRQTLEIRNLS